MRIIRRYSNRRLYDVRDSRTLTQAELADLIRDGAEIRVVDSNTGEDISLQVLGRIVLAEAALWGDVRQTTKLFSNIIQLGGVRSMSILKNTVLASIGAIQVTKARAEKIIDDLIKKGELDKSDRKKAVMELLDKAEKSTAGMRDRIAKEASRAHKEVSRLAKEVREYKLIKRVDLKKMESKLDKLTKTVASLEKRLAAKD
ncbi:MAG: polyhydroxyalkanoate synthesis regulator DNA-binding domain-containing protein [bacterium]